MFFINVLLKDNLGVMYNLSGSTNRCPSSPWNSHEKKWQADKSLQWQKHSQTPVSTEISTAYRAMSASIQNDSIRCPRKGRVGKGSPRTQTSMSTQGLQGRKCIPGTTTRSVCPRQRVGKGVRDQAGAGTCDRDFSRSERQGEGCLHFSF